MNDLTLVWMWVWKISLLSSLVLFAVMAVVVTIGGAFDIRRLLARLSNPKGRPPENG